MKQEVIQYESDLINKGPQINVNPQRYDPHYMRYSNWELHQTLEHILNRHDYSLKWIGNDPNANVLAFFYCVLSGCLKDDEGGDNLFIKLKYNLYQESKQTLPLNEQKTFVEHIRLAEHSKNIGEFLKKSRYLESTLIKIFNIRKTEMLRNHLIDLSTPPTKIQQLQLYSVSFPFFNFQTLTQKCGKVTVKDQTYFIVQEKDCFFVVQDCSYSIISSNMSRVSNNTKKINKSPQKQKIIQSFDSQKQLNRNNSATVPSFLGKLKKKNEKQSQLSQSDRQKPRKQIKKYEIQDRYQKSNNFQLKKNNKFNSEIDRNIKKRQKSQKNQRIKGKESAQRVKQSKSFKIFQNQNVCFGNIRTSLGQIQKSNFSYFQGLTDFNQQLQPQRVLSTENNERSHIPSLEKVISVGKRKMTKSKVQMPQANIHGNHPSQRQNFIYQSLGSNDSKEKINIPINAPFVSSGKKKPQFLEKKNQQPSFTGALIQYKPSTSNFVEQFSFNSSRYLVEKKSPKKQEKIEQSNSPRYNKTNKVFSQKKMGYWSPKQNGNKINQN